MNPFSSSARLYDALTETRRDYRDQAERIKRWILDYCPSATSLLDVACGTGLHAAYLGDCFRVEGLDISSEMLKIARSRNPGMVFHEGDMTGFDLGRRFDAVICMFSSITYSRTIRGLHSALACMARHTRHGGVCLLEPYIPAEDWRDGALGLTTGEGQGFKVAVVDRNERHGRKVRRSMLYAVTWQNRLEHIYEEHEFGLFTRPEYEHAFTEAGFGVEFNESGFDPSRGMYIGTLCTDPSLGCSRK